jgi:hypothetical protein
VTIHDTIHLLFGTFPSRSWRYAHAMIGSAYSALVFTVRTSRRDILHFYPGPTPIACRSFPMLDDALRDPGPRNGA